MGILTLILCVIPTIVTSITISPNGNSPEVKMIGGMMVDMHNGFQPMTQTSDMVEASTVINEKKSKLADNSTKLSANERYRRLIPYMTFYYANNDLPPRDADIRGVEVEKAQIVEAKALQNSRQVKKIVYAPQRHIPRYQGNRLTHFNIASANPTKVIYKEVPYYQPQQKFIPNHNPIILEQPNDFEPGRLFQKHVKPVNNNYGPTTRKPLFNFYGNEEAPGVQYYVPPKDNSPKFKLVPYEQTPVKIVPTDVYENKNPIPVPVLVPKEPVYIKPKPVRPQFSYDEVNGQPLVPRKQPLVVSESYYEKQRPLQVQSIPQPVIESGFRPILSPAITTQSTMFTTNLPASSDPQFVNERPAESSHVVPEQNFRPNYYQYVVEQPTYKPEVQVQVPSKTMSLADLLNSLQLNKSIPKPITKENVGTSIRTLLQVLNTLKAMSNQNEVEAPVLSTPKPFVAPVLELTPKSIVDVTPAPAADPDLHEEPYLAQVNPPSQHLDDFPTGGGTSQQFPLPVHSDEEGGTPGRPGVDYPVLTTIPPTAFDCKTQRYKGFFADPETRCQVWHYCDLNGGQASFLCPNGTIFSQAGLTCDWWFNVRCAATTQLYVLNESLYKYILPHSPKFPEDYSGPLVDKYLTLKFKEMEEQFRKNKNKQSASDKADSEEDDKGEDSTEKESETGNDDDVSSVSEASVIVDNHGTSGNVERLSDEK